MLLVLGAAVARPGLTVATPSHALAVRLLDHHTWMSVLHSGPEPYMPSGGSMLFHMARLVRKPHTVLDHTSSSVDRHSRHLTPGPRRSGSTRALIIVEATIYIRIQDLSVLKGCPRACDVHGTRQ